MNNCIINYTFTSKFKEKYYKERTRPLTGQI